MDICVDFDGTCVTHAFPKVGEDIGAVPVLKELVENGHNLILFTMRSNVSDNTGFSAEVPEIHNGNFLDDAINWFKENDIPLYGIQENPTQKNWTTSPKAYGQMYIDDAALGCPLCIKVSNHTGTHIVSYWAPAEKSMKKHWKFIDRPFVDWKTLRDIFVGREMIKEK